jgi:pimeloyl-ACP methyl ester carboxylesterase
MELRDAYLAVASHPENLQLFFDKALQRMRDFQDIPTDEIRGIRAPALVIVGDVDVVRPEHAVEEFRLLPHARLAILPNTDHMALMSRSEWLVPMVDDFLKCPDANNPITSGWLSIGVCRRAIGDRHTPINDTD